MLTSWDKEGNVTYGELPTGVAPMPGMSGGVYIRRFGEKVTLSFIGAKATSTGPTVTIPEGFRVYGAPYPYTNLNPVKSSGPITVKVGAYMIYLSGFSIGDNMADTSSSYGSSVVWDSTQPWPTSLPGIPR